MAVLDYSAKNPAVPQAGADRGVCPVWITLECSVTETTAAGSVLIAKMPEVAFIRNQAGVFYSRWDDLDTNATETLDFDLGFGPVAGTLDVTFLNNGTAVEDAGQAANSLIATSDPWIDVGGKYLTMLVNTESATPAAGDVEIGFEYTQNVINQSVSA